MRISDESVSVRFSAKVGGRVGVKCVGSGGSVVHG